MNQQLQNILNFLQQSEQVSAEEKAALLKSISALNKELEITYFKLDRTEKVKKTTAILLEETIQELEQKRKAVEAQNRELEIEAALQRVRSKAMSMQKSEDLADAVAIVFEELDKLNLGMLRCGIGILDATKRSVDVWTTTKSEGETIVQVSGDESMDIHPLLQGAFDAWLQQNEDYSYVLQGEDLTRFYSALTKTNFKLPDSQTVEFATEDDKQFYYTVPFHAGALYAFRETSFPDEAKKVMKRFADVFNLTYTRFNDLKKAEEQTREAQIELGLERVRARAMAMQNSIELNELIGTVFIELTKLDLVLTRCLIMIYDPETKDSRWWMANSEVPDHPMNFLIKYHKLPPYLAYVKAWEDRMLRWNFTLEGKDKEAWDDFLFVETELSLLPDFVIAGMRSPDRVYLNASFNNFGNLTLATLDPLSSEHFDILLRFAKVFDLTYTRFNDLKTAEAQAREAKIEASLERVRSKAMAMHNSEDLSATIAVFYRELQAFSITPRRCGVGLLNKETRIAELSTMNTTVQGDSIEVIGHIKMAKHPVLEEVFDNWLLQKEYHPVLRGNEIKEYYQLLRPQIAFPEYPNDAVQYGHFFFFPDGAVYAWTEKELAEDELKIYRRFTSVLSLTYRRYKDLKEAEAQAREAQIEACLERVRAKAMAMHSSEDLAETIKVFYQQMTFLGIPARRCGVGLIDKETHTADITSMNITEEGEVREVTGKLNLKKHPVLEKVYDSWLSKEEYHPVLRGEQITEYYRQIGSQISFQNYPQDAVQFGYFFFFTEGTVFVWTEKEFTENELKLYRRFSTVLNLTYKRYIDLKTAEAQAREAQIEVALERIRAKALAMQTSADLLGVAIVLREQMGILGQPDLESSIVHLYHDNAESFESWYAYRPPGRSVGNLILGNVHVSKSSTEWAREAIDNYKSPATEYTIESRGQKIREWYKMLEKVAPATIEYDDRGNMVVPEVLYYHFSKFSGGSLLMISNQLPSIESCELQKRAAAVFDLAYTRFQDLQKSEANAREAVRRASLDRVRAEIASMRTTTDLERITPLIWNELRILGVSFTRCGVFIMNDQREQIQTFLSTPAGKAIAAFELSYKTPGTAAQVLVHWRRKEIYREHWDHEAFINWTKSLIEQGAISSKEKYLTEDHPSNLHLHFLPFIQGMLYVGSEAPLDNEEIQLVQALAETFSTAYSRYEDFNQLETAKQQVENTLVDLKQAQSQLIQSEKMASLGELTAGIAHEIQNPLNFINNFSEVNRELLFELKEEIEKRNIEEIQVIATDIIKNEEKINHHGKRADAIVKGMLQHSRTTSAVKEPTDINKLADEYLRLAFHGLRAKDKTFNATIKTNFDESIGHINIIPQDIGRALLNLYNNAFYAVIEKKKQASTSTEARNYEPTVIVATKSIKPPLGGLWVSISVKDNGNGIPQKVLDKIFQPFFTTKPTGQGTGLGLSLAYDIIKAHDGQLNVETKENEGADFIISLPINQMI